MYDELVKRLRELASIPEHCENIADCDQCSKEDICFSFTNKRINEVATQAADAIEELSKPRWIPVTERLPSEKDRYLTVSIEPWFGTTVVDTMRWSGVWMYGGRQTEATVTHWMPLPEPPKEET